MRVKAIVLLLCGIGGVVRAELPTAREVKSVVAEVRAHAGAPALWLDGRPVPGLMHWNRWVTGDDVAVFAKAGVHLYSFMGAPEMPAPDGGKTSYEDGQAKKPILTDDFVNRTMAAIVAADPEARVLVRLRLTTPDWWRKAHSNETVRELRGTDPN